MAYEENCNAFNLVRKSKNFSIEIYLKHNKPREKKSERYVSDDFVEPEANKKEVEEVIPQVVLSTVTILVLGNEVAEPVYIPSVTLPEVLKIRTTPRGRENAA